jgi:hypothetical protein
LAELQRRALSVLDGIATLHLPRLPVGNDETLVDQLADVLVRESSNA